MPVTDGKPGMAASKVHPVPESDVTDLTLALDDNRTASMVFGHYDQNLARIERRLNVVLTANGNHVVIKGAAEPAGHARRVLQILCERARTGRPATRQRDRHQHEREDGLTAYEILHEMRIPNQRDSALLHALRGRDQPGFAALVRDRCRGGRQR